MEQVKDIFYLKIKSYFANDDKSEIVKPDDEGEFSTVDGLKKYTDIVYYDKINLFDVKSNKRIISKNF